MYSDSYWVYEFLFLENVLILPLGICIETAYRFTFIGTVLILPMGVCIDIATGHISS